MSEKPENPQLATSLRSLISGSEELVDTPGTTSSRTLLAGSQELGDAQGETDSRRTIIVGSEEDPDTICDPLTERCQKHPDEFVKLYCNKHKQLGCVICIAQHHKKCKDVSCIQDISRGIADSEELKKLHVDLKKLISELECSKSQSEWCKLEADDNYNQMVADVKIFRRKINTFLDKIEGELLNKASSLKKEILDGLSSEATRCAKLNSEIKDMETKLNKLQMAKYNNQLYVATKSVTEKLSVLEKEAAVLNETIRTQRFVFRRDDKLDKMTSSITRFGTLDVKSNYVRAKYLRDITVNPRNSYITGAIVLPDGRLAVSDANIMSVRIVDTVSGENVEVASQSLSSSPNDITLIGEDQLAVVLKKQDYIQVLSLSPTLSVSHTITMPGQYNGITYSEGKFILTCYSDKSVHICDMSGNLLQKIHKDNSERDIFTGYPTNITTSPGQSLIYVSDWKSNKVITLTRAGVVMTTYINDRLKGPHGVTVDNTGCLYVCSHHTHTIHQLSAGGQFIKILLEMRDGIVRPWAITHGDGKLYIVCDNNIKVYRLE